MAVDYPARPRIVTSSFWKLAQAKPLFLLVLVKAASSLSGYVTNAQI
jgi:hypothetical protein